MRKLGVQIWEVSVSKNMISNLWRLRNLWSLAEAARQEWNIEKKHFSIER